MQSKLAYVRFGTGFLLSTLVGRRSLTCLWELTYRCNARCAICGYWRHPSRPRDEMAFTQIRDGLERVHRHGCRFVNFTGGEPTLRRDLVDIVAYASRLGMWTSMVTNGGTLTRDRVRSLKGAGLDSLMISIDSVHAAVHDDQRGVPGLHERAIESLRIVAEEFLGGLRIGGMFCVLAPHNLDTIDGLVALADELGALVEFQPYHERKTGCRDFCVAVTPSHAGAIRRLNRARSIIVNSNPYLAGMVRFTAGEPMPRCRAGRKYFSIDPFGYLHSCVDMPPAGHVLRDPITVLLRPEARRQVDACTGCWYCFRGESDAVLTAAGLADRLRLGIRIARRNPGRQRSRALPVVGTGP